jgi:hypothetical protein
METTMGFEPSIFEFPIQVTVNIKESTPKNIFVNWGKTTVPLKWFEWLDAPTEIFELIKKWK